MINLNKFEQLIVDAKKLSHLDYSKIVPGEYYCFSAITEPKIYTKYIRVIHILREGGLKIESLKGTQNHIGWHKKGEPGIWYISFNLDLFRQNLTQVSLKGKALDFADRSGCPDKWFVTELPENISRFKKISLLESV